MTPRQLYRSTRYRPEYGQAGAGCIGARGAARGKPLTPREPSRRTPGKPLAPREPSRQNPGKPLTPRSPRKIPGKPLTPRSPRKIPGKPLTPRSPRKIPGEPLTPRSPRKIPGEPLAPREPSRQNPGEPLAPREPSARAKPLTPRDGPLAPSQTPHRRHGDASRPPRGTSEGTSGRGGDQISRHGTLQ